MANNPYSKDFPIFNDTNLVYLDSAATSQKPSRVIEAMRDYYLHTNANPHRGLYSLSAEATRLYERGRKAFASFINAGDPSQIVFLRNATEALNLLALSYATSVLGPGDEVVIPISEHHSNLVPWQQVCKRTGASLVYLSCNQQGGIDDEELEKKITKRTRIVSFAQVGNVMGVALPAGKLIAKAHRVGAIAIVDCTQSIAHMVVDVTALDCDFAVFSSHKMFGPTGVGMLYGKLELLEKIPPLLTGGDMIEYVTEQETTFAEIPQRFEAGTQDVAGVVGLTAALSYIDDVGYEAIQRWEDELTGYCLERLSALPWVTVYGEALQKERRFPLVTFTVEGIHPHDIASLLDSKGIAVRAGHHCAQPLMHYLGVQATCRASLSIYNSKEDIDRLVDGLIHVRRVFGYAN
ncbi:MAG: SufS family cysteine desulfurase [Sphaerochaeta sp.]|nr:SufS family cysteine desulfurase [Sphaerochaeta sp.]